MKKSPLYDPELTKKITEAGRKILSEREGVAEIADPTTKRYDRLRVGGTDYIPADEAVRQVMEVQKREQALLKVIRNVLTWAEQRCPCHNDEPKICPLCLADAAKDACMSAENTIPRHLLTELRSCLPTSPYRIESPAE